MIVDLVCCDKLEADSIVILQVTGALYEHCINNALVTMHSSTYRKLAPNPGMHTGVRHELLLMCEVKECAMSNARLLGGLARICWPCIEVGIEVDDRYGTIDLVQSPEDGENNGMVSAHAVEPGNEEMQAI